MLTINLTLHTQATRHFHRVHLTILISCSPAAAPPTPGTGPEAGVDFTTLPVHDLMRLYYSESARSPYCAICHCPSAVNDTVSLQIEAAKPADAAAGRLFPHQEFFRWLAYGNGEVTDGSCPYLPCELSTYIQQ
jgi:hypothetical protein